MNIRQRVTLWVTAAGFSTSLIFSSVVFWELAEQPYAILDTQLNSTAGFVADLLRQGHVFPRDATDPPVDGEVGGILISIYDQDMQPLYRSFRASEEALPAPTNQCATPYTSGTGHEYHSAWSFLTGMQHTAYRVMELRLEVDAAPRLIQVAIPIENLHEELRELLLALGVGLAVSSIMLLGISFFLAGRIVRPMKRIMGHVRRCNENTLAELLPLNDRRDEINALSADLNRMFDRLRSSFVRQKQYLAAASHELKTPLAMLRLFFDEAEQRRDLPEEFSTTLRRQGRNILRLDRMVRSLMDLSAMEAGGAMSWERVDLAGLVRGVLEDFAALTGCRRLRLTTHLVEAVAMEGDRDKLRRLLVNIIDNAIKFNHEDGWIELSLASRDGWVTLTVANGGRGIPREELDKVFEHFHRVDKSRAGKYGGAGLGLAIVREIVRLHRGTVLMESVPACPNLRHR